MESCRYFFLGEIQVFLVAPPHIATVSRSLREKDEISDSEKAGKGTRKRRLTVQCAPLEAALANAELEPATVLIRSLVKARFSSSRSAAISAVIVYIEKQATQI
eukprot:IDg20432t1